MKLLLTLSLFLSFNLFATETLSQAFSKLKQDEIQSNDIVPTEKAIQKITGSKVEIKPDWKSFEKSGYNEAQELGADIQMLPEVFQKLMDDKEVNEKVKTSVKTFSFKHNPKAASPSVTFEKGTATLHGNYLQMNWGKMEKGISATIKDLLLKQK